MPIRHRSIHQIDKKPDGSPAVLHVSDKELFESQATENLLNHFNEAYNAKQGKAKQGKARGFSTKNQAPTLSAAG